MADKDDAGFSCPALFGSCSLDFSCTQRCQSVRYTNQQAKRRGPSAEASASGGTCKLLDHLHSGWDSTSKDG
eukprot:1160118-Pelagomonas_calceolata.AAC.2